MNQNIYSKWIYAIVVILFSFIIFSGFLHQILCLKFPYPLEYREGVVQMWVNSFIKGQPLYPEIQKTPLYLHNPYTPVYYILTGFIKKILPQGSVFFAGRIMSFLCMVFSCFFIFKIALLKVNKIAGFLSIGLFFCSPIVINYGCLEIVDMMALSFGLAGIYNALKKDTLGLIFSGALCAFSILTKPTFILPGISVLVSNIYDRNIRKKYFLMSFTGCIVGSFLILFLIYRGNLFEHLIILNRLPWNFYHFINTFAVVGVRHVFLFGALCVFIGIGKNKKDPLYWYCVFSPLTFLFSAKIGSESNYFLEIIALSAISYGILFVEGTFLARKIFTVVCTAQLFLFLPFKPAPVFTKTYGQEIPAAISSEPSVALKEAGDAITGELMSVFDPVFSEDIGWLIVAEKNVIIEPYQFSQLAKVGRWDDDIIVEMIKEKKFNLILMNSESYEKFSERFTKNMIDAVKENYSVRRIIGNTYILEPIVSWNFNKFSDSNRWQEDFLEFFVPEALSGEKLCLEIFMHEPATYYLDEVSIKKFK